MHRILEVLLAFSHLLACVAAASEYNEQLFLRPLPPSHLLASFNFQSNTSLQAFNAHDFRYFPRSLGQILQHANTRELHLRFSLGRWDAERWGARPWGGAKEGGTGVELWAWVDAKDDEEADSHWLTLTNALSGLFCASLNFIDSTHTTRPILSFQPAGDHSNSTSSDLHLLHGTLPREVVCTENLTPFLKLLPCKGKAGISSLLDGHKLFDASWQSMSIDVIPICSEASGDCVLQITQTIDMVLDISRSKRPRDNPIPRPVHPEELKCNTSKPYHSHDTCFPLDEEQEGWMLSELFAHRLKGRCPLAEGDPEVVCINVPHAQSLEVYGIFLEQRHTSGYNRCYKIAESQDFEIVMPSHTLSDRAPLSQPPLYAERSFIGYGQERGGVQAILTNPSTTETVEFVYMESLPWFMKVYLHTLKASLQNPTNTNTNQGGNELIKEMYYRPALDRKRGTQLEILLSLPPNSTAILTYDFEKAILRYTEYPPDANRGFDVAGAIITLKGTGEAIRTTSLLLPLPTPDFSMPYNVIILTSTVMALSFGHIFNLLVRRFVGKDEGPEGGLGVLKERVRGRVATIVARFGAKTQKVE